MNEKEYYYNGGYVTIYADVTDHPDMVVVSDNSDYGDLMVVRRNSLVPKEESYTYRQELKRKEELEAITAKAKADLDAVADKIVDKALIALASRIKFNAFFSNNVGETASWAVMVVKELQDLIKEKGPDMIKKGEIKL